MEPYEKLKLALSNKFGTGRGRGQWSVDLSSQTVEWLEKFVIPGFEAGGQLTLPTPENLMTKKWPGPTRRNLRLIVNCPIDTMSYIEPVKAISDYLRNQPTYRDTGAYPEAFCEEFQLAFLNEYMLARHYDWKAYLTDTWGIEVRHWESYAERECKVSRQFDPGQPFKFGLVAMVSRVDQPRRWREIFRMLVEHLSAKWGNGHPDVTRFKLGWLTRIYTHGGDPDEYLREWGIRVEEAYQFAGQQSVRKESE